ncbi:NAD(P)H-dependent oxidoreductase [Pelobium manganitolerans]|nr:NAD(P)H-dependent oxidoreductase [Pelobium manganitolerans]
MMEQVIESLKWRYATKSFDADKQLSESQLNILKNAVQLAPSSFGLQPYQVVVVQNKEVKQQLRTAAFNQTQLEDASHIFVFAIEKQYAAKHVDAFIANVANTRNTSVESLKGFEDLLKTTVNSRSAEELDAWNSKQAYIGLGILLETAALYNIDACPMEGFNATEFNRILGLDERNLHAVAIAAVGFRSDDDKYQHYAKVRKSYDDLFIHI